MGDTANEPRATGAALAPVRFSYRWYWRFS
jgi:hypothetical protein